MESDGERFYRHLGEAMDEAWGLATKPEERPVSELTAVGAALVRLRAEVGARDMWSDEDVTVRVGDIWALLEEVERLKAAVVDLRVALDDILARPEDPGVLRRAEWVFLRTGVDG
jgi:hypothetical protein